MAKSLKVRRRSKIKNNSTDINLLVSPESKEEFIPWDKDKIIEALLSEASLTKSDATKIANNVENRVLKSELSAISTSLIRELVDNELFEMGLQKPLQKQQTIGLPKHDIEELILSRSKENSNIATNNPEAIGHSLSETILKQYALQEIFSTEVANAHKYGMIHIHDLGYCCRLYCSSHSLEYIKKYGLILDNIESSSAPAKHARTLTVHLNTFLSSMQMYYAGALGIAYVNVMYAPYLEGMSDEEILQEAQHLIFQSSQNAFSRGGQALFIDFNIHTGIPGYLKNVKAIGPGGKYTGKTYGEYEDTAIKFAMAMLKIWGQGDSNNTVMAFPKNDLHINKETFDSPKQLEVLKYACEIASKNGSVYFIFDRDEVTLSACCRLRTTIDDNYMIDHPESMRYCGFQNVTINLPQCAYRAGKGNIDGFFDELDKMVDICVKAHLQKKEFISKLMIDPTSPLWQIGRKGLDNRPYVDLDTCTYIIGVIGLNECIHYLLGKELHEDENIIWQGLRIIGYLYFVVKEAGKKYGMKFTIEESPAESAARRLAKIDERSFDDAIVRGDGDRIYYTNSIHMRPDANIDLLTRIKWQSKFHSLIESGAIIHAFVGEHLPSKKNIFKLIDNVFHKTDAAQLTISPEFTHCKNCNKTTLGLQNKCLKCGSVNINGLEYINETSGVKWSDKSIAKLLASMAT